MSLVILALLYVFIVINPGDVLLSQERVVLSTPQPSVTEYRISELLLGWGVAGDCAISVRLVPNVPSAQELQHSYRGPEACTMLRALNTANLSTVSLQRRIMNQLITDKVLIGAASGVPE